MAVGRIRAGNSQIICRMEFAAGIIHTGVQTGLTLPQGRIPPMALPARWLLRCVGRL